MLRFISIIIFALSCCVVRAEDDREILEAINKVFEYCHTWSEPFNNKNIVKRFPELHGSLFYAVENYLSQTPWKKHPRKITDDMDDKTRDQILKEIETDLDVVTYALTLNDDAIILGLFCAFDITTDEISHIDYDHTISENGFGLSLVKEEVKKDEPERFVPAAMGILDSYNYTRVRKLMCQFIDQEEYEKLTEPEKLIFRRVWKIMDEQLKDGNRVLDFKIKFSVDLGKYKGKTWFTNFKAEIAAMPEVKDKDTNTK